MLMTAKNGCGLLPLPMLANRTNDVPIKLSRCYSSDEKPKSQYSIFDTPELEHDDQPVDNALQHPKISNSTII